VCECVHTCVHIMLYVCVCVGICVHMCAAYIHLRYACLRKLSI